MNFKKILVPVTLADGSRAAVAVAANLAKESGASLALLHAVQLSIAGEERGIPRTRLVDDLCREAESQLRQLLQSVTLQTPTEIIVREGRPAGMIVESARCLAVDAIVMSSVFVISTPGSSWRTQRTALSFAPRATRFRSDANWRPRGSSVTVTSGLAVAFAGWATA